MQVHSVVSEVRRVFWVEWFHNTPHVNLTLHPVNSTFNPFSPVYQEHLATDQSSIIFRDNTIATLNMIKDEDEDDNLEAALDLIAKRVRKECSEMEYRSQTYTTSISTEIAHRSLGIIGSIPAGLLILTLLILLLYLLTRCCDNRPRKPGSITCLKVTLVLFAILTLSTWLPKTWQDVCMRLKRVTKAANLIKKSALQDRLYQRLCEEIDEEFERLIFYTEVR
ncbi:Protein tweety [Chionoecetes opilio]|uniref:Protein tweety homolog n=1 Tax=Chionoecetes opilio TaxID=41210 RepID=A0A8J4XV70_CHIOP|nr:Protein tweety [Chionoecetes opilio]